MTVINLLAPVAGLVKVRYRGEKADIDSQIFKLHYKTSATICLICCLLVTANDLIGSTIDCISDGLPGNVINTYCWIMSTFSMPSIKAIKYFYEIYKALSQIKTVGITPIMFQDILTAFYQVFVLFSLKFCSLFRPRRREGR